MLCIKLKSFDRPCGTTSGGVSRVWIFDREDFNFTQAAADADGNKPGYTVITRRAGATAIGGALLFPVLFQYQEAEYKYAQSRKGSSVKYTHTLEAVLPDLGQFITQWNEKVDQAGACCGIGLIIELNSGKIIVLGEKYVNTVAIREWRIGQDGASGTSGKLFDDENIHTAVLVGDFFRGAYEFTGGVAAIVAMQDDGSAS